MFKAYVNRMHATNQQGKDNADKDLMLFTKSLMSAMYDSTSDIVIGKAE
jgi:hypothetical protein